MTELWWKYTATALFSMMVTLGGAWLTTNHNAVTAPEVQQMIAPDRDTLRELRGDMKRLDEKLDTLNREIGELKGMLRR